MVQSSALRSSNLEIVVADNTSRVIAFRRWDETGTYLVAGSLNNQPYNQPGYTLTHPALAGTWWRECFNSDGDLYGGDNGGNEGNTLSATSGSLTVVIPANGVVVFEQEPNPNPD